MSSNDPKQDVEEGVPEDTKSDAGSATTAPSVESGDDSHKEAAAAAPKSRRTMLLGGAAAVLVVAGVVIGAVMGTCGKNKSTSTSSSKATAESISLGGEDEAPPMYPTYPYSNGDTMPKFDAPFGDIELPLFQADVLESYSTVEDLQVDLTKATKEMINKIILQNIAYASANHNYYYGDRPLMMDPEEQPMEDIAMEAGVGMASASAKQASQKKVLNSMTNNQEKDVDESDVLKTDGSYVYAAYGDYLVVWDLQGNVVTQDKMPVPEAPEKEEMMFDDDGNMLPEDLEFMMEWASISAYAYIDSIQMTENHIIVVVGGLGQYSDDDIGYGEGGTHIRVYNKPTAANPTLELVATRELSGYFFSSSYLEESNSVHIITGGDFSTYSAIVEPLDVYHFNGLNQTEYYYAAKLLAENQLIPQFVKRLTEFLMTDGKMPEMMKVNNWMTAAQKEAKKDQKSHPEDHFYGNYDESMRAYMFVTSIQADAIPTTPTLEGSTLQVSTTCMLGPSSWGYMYAVSDNIVLNMQKYEFNLETEHSEETLFLVHLKVADSSETSFHSLTSLPGNLPSIRAVDILGDDLRVATTHQKWFPLENVWPVCGDSWYFEDTCMTEENWNDCFEVALGCREVVKTGCPYTFECADQEATMDDSSTDNFVSVFDISQPGQMQERGSVRIGEPHERIMGVHFGETFSYANTFDQRDPFYVLSLPAGQAPTIAGELKLEGFSSFLQPLNEDATLVVGIGQNVTGEGMEQAANGLLVTVFDVSDPSNPKALASEMLANPNEMDSYSDAEWDPKAVQLNDGTLVIPLTLYYKYNGENDDAWRWPEATVPPGEMEMEMMEEGADDLGVMPPDVMMMESKNFEGFIVLDLTDVANQGIKEVTRISHTQSHNGDNDDCHYCSAGMAYRRAFLFDDKSLMTVHDNAVVSTDLASGNMLWSFNVTMEGETNCCY